MRRHVRVLPLLVITAMLCGILPPPALVSAGEQASFQVAPGVGCGGVVLNPASVTSADINGDGRPDLATANYALDSVSVLLNRTPSGDMSPTFAAAASFGTGRYPAAVASADFDGDGRPDLAVSCLGSGAVSILLNRTAPGADTPNLEAALTSLAVSNPAGVVSGDFNGDGRADLAVANAGPCSIWVFLNETGAGATEPVFASATVFDVGTGADSYPRHISSVDVDGDGRPDLAVASTGSSNMVDVLLNQTESGATIPDFAAPSSLPLTGGPSDVAWGDLNSDGRPDLAVADSSSQTLSVFRNETLPDGPPTFIEGQTISTPYPGSLTVGDLNGDGRRDLAAACGSYQTVSVFLNETPAGESSSSFASAVSFVAGRHPISLTPLDVNSDGRLDLAAALEGSTSLVLLMNQTLAGAPSPSFIAPVSLPAGSTPVGVTSADFNGDGRSDLAVTDQVSDEVAVLLNRTPPRAATPSFAPAAFLPVGDSPRGVASADLNGDGRPDLVVTNEVSHTVSVFLNQTPSGSVAPSFSTEASFAAGLYPHSVCPVDIDLDGRPDLAVANNSVAWGTVSVLLNETPPGETSPRFAEAVAIRVSMWGPKTVVSGDLNGDGVPDLAVAGGSPYVSVLLNLTPPGATSPAFSSEGQFAVENGNSTVVAADFNGDGLCDLAAASAATADHGSQRVSVLLNETPQGSVAPSFASMVLFTVGTYPVGLVQADFDDDGKPDLAVTNLKSHDLSVLVNQTPSGAASPAFSSALTLKTGIGPYGLTAADLNGDEKPDLAVCNHYELNDVWVLTNSTPWVSTMSMQDAMLSEAEGSTDGRVTITVRRTKEYRGEVSVVWSAEASGTNPATPGVESSSPAADFVVPADPADRTITLADGQDSATFDIFILQDVRHEVDETFTVTLSDPTGGAILGESETCIVTIVDDDEPGVLVTETGSGTAVKEGSWDDTYAIVLLTPPASPVTVTVAGDHQVRAWPKKLEFTAANWDVPQTVKVIAVSDDIVEGTHQGRVTHTVRSDDPDYDGAVARSVSVWISDSDREVGGDSDGAGTGDGSGDAGGDSSHGGPPTTHEPTLLTGVAIHLTLGRLEAVINGEVVPLDAAPFLGPTDRTMVPLRFFCEALGAKVNWDPATGTVTVSGDGTEIVLTVGSSTAYVNGVPVEIDAPPILLPEPVWRTFVPFRFICEILGATVSWDPVTLTVRTER